jgi:hypothetical protein
MASSRLTLREALLPSEDVDVDKRTSKGNERIKSRQRSFWQAQLPAPPRATALPPIGHVNLTSASPPDRLSEFQPSAFTFPRRTSHEKMEEAGPSVPRHVGTCKTFNMFPHDARIRLLLSNAPALSKHAGFRSATP